MLLCEIHEASLSNRLLFSPLILLEIHWCTLDKLYFDTAGGKLLAMYNKLSNRLLDYYAIQIETIIL